MAKLALFALLVSLDGSFLLVVTNAAAGLVPVMVAERLAFRRGHSGAGWVFWGLAFFLLPALVHLLEVEIHPWFDHHDLAHVLMMVGLFLIYRGVGPLQP